MLFFSYLREMAINIFLFQLCCIVLLFSCLAVGGLIGLLVYLGKQFILSSQNFFIALKV
jgi:hypothetical protein